MEQHILLTKKLTYMEEDLASPYWPVTTRMKLWNQVASLMVILYAKEKIWKKTAFLNVIPSQNESILMNKLNISIYSSYCLSYCLTWQTCWTIEWLKLTENITITSLIILIVDSLFQASISRCLMQKCHLEFFRIS